LRTTVSTSPSGYEKVAASPEILLLRARVPCYVRALLVSPGDPYAAEAS